MSFVPQVTCRHCGQKFSALRGRCPNCGTRHVKQTGRTSPAPTSTAAPQGGHAAANVNARWQLIFGAILVVAVIVAVIILITVSLSPAAKEPEPVDTPPLPPVTTPVATPPPPTDTPIPTVPATSITITYAGEQVLSFTQRTTWAATPLRADVYPLEALDYADIVWRSDDETVCTVDENGNVTALETGIGKTCHIIAECGGVATSCEVNVPA